MQSIFSRRRLALFRVNLSDAVQAFSVAALAGTGVAWSYFSDLLIKGETRALAARETARSADGWMGDGEWQLVCEASSCRAEAPRSDREGAVRMSARVATRDAGRALLVEVRTPLGVDIGRGLTIRVGTENARVAFARCEPRGCVATFFPEVFFVTALRHAPSIDFGYALASANPAFSAAAPAGETVWTRLPMHGFGAAVSRLR